MSDTIYSTLLQALGFSNESAQIVADHILELERELNAARARIAELESQHASPTPLLLPDKPGWWWKWSNDATPPRWLPVHVLWAHQSGTGQWLPATPPAAPKTEDEKL